MFNDFAFLETLLAQSEPNYKPCFEVILKKNQKNFEILSYLLCASFLFQNSLKTFSNLQGRRFEAVCLGF
jgi:hypothetical protein